MAARATDSEPLRVVTGVDGDPVTRSLVALYLEPRGYAVHIAAGMADALRLAAQGAGALFLCGERAWAGASAEERRKLRQALEHARVVLVLEPGSPGVGQAWEGVSERLHKPIRAEALLALLAAAPAEGAGTAAAGSASGVQAGPGGDGLAGLRELIAEMEMEAPMVRELMESFLSRAPVYLADLRAALAGAEWERLERAAHAMKGMCGNLRFGALVTQCDHLRAAGRARDGAAAGSSLAALEEEHGRIAAAVRAADLVGT